MPEFFVDITITDADSDEFMELIPSQRAVINELLYEGKITSYSVSLERTKLWAIVVAPTEDDVFTLLATFPLIEFMEIQVYPLLFHNTNHQSFSQISLN